MLPSEREAPLATSGEKTEPNEGGISSHPHAIYPISWQFNPLPRFPSFGRRWWSKTALVLKTQYYTCRGREAEVEGGSAACLLASTTGGAAGNRSTKPPLAAEKTAQDNRSQ